MLMDVYKLIFKILENKIVDNSNFINRIETSYPHRTQSYITLINRELRSPKYSYHHIHSTY